MDDMDKVSDLTFSQPMSTPAEVAQAVLDLCGNNMREQVMPARSGVLTTIVGLMPWLGRLMRPTLESKGQRIKKALKAEARAARAAEN